MIIKDIAILFLSIILEAVPFLLLGVIISSIIQVFVPDEVFRKVIPKNPILGSIFGVLMGFFIPACDCAVIPISMRLYKKKVPLNVCISFMLASPIINPVVILGTIYSFRNIVPEIVLYRIILGILIAIIIGIIVSITTKKEEVLKSKEDDTCKSKCCSAKKYNSKLQHFIEHSKNEFLEILKYMMIGTLIASIAQSILNTNLITGLANQEILQTIIMMLFAYLISLCSTADSFIGRTFLYQISNSSILAFLLLGPMIDVKNTIVLLENYNKKFVIKLISLIFIAIFIVSLIVTI